MPENKINIAKILINGHNYYVRKIDGTHLYMSNDEGSLARNTPPGNLAHHVNEFRGTGYYDALKTWLKGGRDIQGQSFQEGVMKESSKTIAGIEKILKDKNRGKVDGIMIDTTTASMVKQVYDKVNPSLRKRLDKLDAGQLINVVHKVLKKESKGITEGLATYEEPKGVENRYRISGDKELSKRFNLSSIKDGEVISKDTLGFPSSLARKKALKMLKKESKLNEAYKKFKSAVELGDGKKGVYYLHKVGMDANGNYSYMVSRGANKPKKIQHQGNWSTKLSIRDNESDITNSKTAKSIIDYYESYINENTLDEAYNYNKKIGKYDIGASQHATGTFFYNRNQKKHGDYKLIAKIQNGKVTFLDKKLPPEVKKHIEKAPKKNKPQSMNEAIDSRLKKAVRSGNVVWTSQGFDKQKNNGNTVEYYWVLLTDKDRYTTPGREELIAQIYRIWNGDDVDGTPARYYAMQAANTSTVTIDGRQNWKITVPTDVRRNLQKAIKKYGKGRIIGIDTSKSKPGMKPGASDVIGEKKKRK